MEGKTSDKRTDCGVTNHFSGYVHRETGEVCGRSNEEKSDGGWKNRGYLGSDGSQIRPLFIDRPRVLLTDIVTTNRDTHMMAKGLI